MGKNLQGKEIGEGIVQKKNGKYLARYRSKTGKRPEKQFDKIGEAKRWLTEQKYQEEHGNIAVSNNITVDAWFNYWMENIKKPTIRNSTYVTYSTRYRKRVSPYIGNRLLKDIKPMHCQNIINKAHETDSHSSVAWVRLVLGQTFQSAVDNGLIVKSPLTNTVKLQKKVYQERRVLDQKEQIRFENYIDEHNSQYKDLYKFVLETGLRTGEVTGLKWSDVNFKKRTITIRRSLEYINKVGFVENPPKTIAGNRTIPLTQAAYEILMSNHSKIVGINNYVFFTGNLQPISICSLDRSLKRICKKSGIEHFSMHTLRHTFATRCIERGMNPKTLQKILGHSSINMTMNLYVHVTDETMIEEIKRFEQGGWLMGGLAK